MLRKLQEVIRVTVSLLCDIEPYATRNIFSGAFFIPE